MHPRAIRPCLSLGLLVALAGCASMRQQQALYEEAHRYVYPQAIEAVWPKVVAFVSEEGYPPRKGHEEFILVTEWREDMQESRVVSSASRLYVEGYRVGRGTSAVRIFKQTIFTGNKGDMTARENRVINSISVGAAGDISPLDYDPISLSHQMGSTPDHTPLTRPPPQASRTFGRDGELEWKLLQHLDAEAAKALEVRVATRMGTTSSPARPPPAP